jgi:hypothetical protein
MVNPQAIRQQLQSAATNYDPDGMAAAVALPPISTAKTGNEPKSHSPKSLMMGDVDYGGLLVSLLDAHSAAEAVSMSNYFSFPICLFWTLIFTLRFRTANHKGDAEKCYQAQASVHSKFNRLFSSSEGNWLVPAMITICKNTHKVALVADKENENARQRNAKLQNAVQLLQDSYSKTFNDRTEYQVSGFLPSMLLSMNESNIIINISKAHIFIWYSGVEESRCSRHCESTLWNVLSSQYSSTLQELDKACGNPKIEWKWNHGTDGDISVLYWTVEYVWRSAWVGRKELGFCVWSLSSKLGSEQKMHPAISGSYQALSGTITNYVL